MKKFHIATIFIQLFMVQEKKLYKINLIIVQLEPQKLTLLFC